VIPPCWRPVTGPRVVVSLGPGGLYSDTLQPGFVPHGHSVGVTSLLFGAIFVALTAAYWVLLLAVAARVTRWMNEPHTRRRLDTATGGVLIAFGVRLAIES
jgi:threonine/homoserine/homoserine lactone efflux protein